MERGCLLGILTSLNCPAQLCETACLIYRSLWSSLSQKIHLLPSTWSWMSLAYIIVVGSIKKPLWLNSIGRESFGFGLYPTQLKSIILTLSQLEFSEISRCLMIRGVSVGQQSSTGKVEGDMGQSLNQHLSVNSVKVFHISELPILCIQNTERRDVIRPIFTIL